MCRRGGKCICADQDPQSLGFAWSTAGNEDRDLKYLAGARMIMGIAVTSFAIWAWSDLSQPVDFDGGYGNFGRTVRLLQLRINSTIFPLSPLLL